MSDVLVLGTAGVVEDILTEVAMAAADYVFV